METFTITEAYKLGDEFYTKNNLWAAEACYAFAEMKPLSLSHDDDTPVDPKKLSNLIKYRQRIKHPLPSKGKGKGTDIPPECLKMIQAFYEPWLQQIKPDMIERSDEHAQRRMKGVIEVFNVVTNNKLGHLILDDIAKENHHQQIDKIKKWNGPSFGKFQIRDNQKVKNNFSLSRLTVVLDFKNYRKRCRNSQEDWFKAIDGKFFAECLEKVYQIFVDKFPDKRQREFMGIVFLKYVLDKHIQFPSASAKLLVPAGTIFANKTGQELREMIHRFHPHVNPLAIKQQAQTRSVKVLHKRLMKIVNDEYKKVTQKGQMDNPLLSLSLPQQKQSQPQPQPLSLPLPQVSVQQKQPMMMAQDSYDADGHESENENENNSVAEMTSNDDGFLQIVNNDDIEMGLININTNANVDNNNDNQFHDQRTEICISSRHSLDLERQYSFNGSQSDASSFIHNGTGSTSDGVDRELEHELEFEGSDNDNDGDEVWQTSINVPYPTMVQFPQQSNRNNNNFRISTATETDEAYNYVQQQPMMEQQQLPIPYEPSQQFQLNEIQIQQQPSATPLPELPVNLNFSFINNHEQFQSLPDFMNVNNNDETLTQINNDGMGIGIGMGIDTGFEWDGMSQFGANPNSSMMPLMNDDNQTTFQPLVSSLSIDVQQQPLPCNTPWSEYLAQNNQNDHDHEQSMQQQQQQHEHQQQSSPPAPSMFSQPKPHHGVNYCECEFCKGFGSNANSNSSNQSITPSLTTPSEITQVNTPSIIGSEKSTQSNSFMHDNAPYRNIQFMPQQYPSRQSSPASNITSSTTYTPLQGNVNTNNNNHVITNPFQMHQPQQQTNSNVNVNHNNNMLNMNAFSDDTVTKDICTGCFESQCKCNSIAMNRRYNKQFQNLNTFNTRNNRIHHRNMQSMNMFKNNNRKQRRQFHIQQLNNMRENSVNLMNNDYNNNNNWSTSMNVRTF